MSLKKLLLTASFSGIIQIASAQSIEAAAGLSTLTKLDFGLQGIGFTYEPRISKKITADLSVGAGGGYDIGEGHIDYRLEMLHPAFYFSLTPKYFYNQSSRTAKGKTTSLNSGNYVGLRLKYVTANINVNDLTRNSVLTNIHWGIQRAIANKWTINSHAGIGYAQDVDYNFGTIYPVLDFKISYILSKSGN